MITKSLFIVLLIVAVSCKKENYDIEDLYPKYQPICDVWQPLSMSYDSVGVRVATPIEYDRLVINDNLSYAIYYDKSDISIENGIVRIVTQTDDILELDFAPDYPITSSYAGSHVFSFSDVVLDSLTTDLLVLSTDECWQFQNVEFTFIK